MSGARREVTTNARASPEGLLMRFQAPFLVVVLIQPAYSSDHMTICPIGLDHSRPIVMLDSGAQVAMHKQVAGNADLIAITSAGLG
jgi:hypothetical protein